MRGRLRAPPVPGEHAPPHTMHVGPTDGAETHGDAARGAVLGGIGVQGPGYTSNRDSGARERELQIGQLARAVKDEPDRLSV